MELLKLKRKKPSFEVHLKAPRFKGVFSIFMRLFNGKKVYLMVNNYRVIPIPTN